MFVLYLTVGVQSRRDSPHLHFVKVQWNVINVTSYHALSAGH